MSEKQKFFELVPSGTHIEFVSKRWRYIWVSILAVVISLGALVYNSQTTGSILNFGIDFAGGSQVRLALDPARDPGVEEVREKLVEFGFEGSSAVTVPGFDNEVLVRVKDTLSIDDEALERCRGAAATAPAADEAEGTAKLLSFNHPEGGSKMFFGFDKEPNYIQLEKSINAAGCEGTADKGFGGKEGESPVEFALIGVGAKMREQFNAAYGEGTVVDIVRSETVGAKVGGQLKEDGAKSMLFAIGFIFLFVMIRFDLRFAPGGILALTHDAMLVIGAFALTGKEFNLQTIAAILTVIGYSINDTIVVFDRVRERVALHRDEPIEKTTNEALNDTLSRTILTSGTTLIVVLATYFMGSGPIKDFAFALIIGVLVGTYSSLFIATPAFLWVNRKFYAGKGHLRLGEEGEGVGALLGGEAQGGKEPPGGGGVDVVGDGGASDGGSAPDGGSDGDGDGDGDGETPDGRRKATRRRRRRRPES